MRVDQNQKEKMLSLHLLSQAAFHVIFKVIKVGRINVSPTYIQSLLSYIYSNRWLAPCDSLPWRHPMRNISDEKNNSAISVLHHDGQSQNRWVTGVEAGQWEEWVTHMETEETKRSETNVNWMKSAVSMENLIKDKIKHNYNLHSHNIKQHFI